MYETDRVPAYVPRSKAAQWARAWNETYNQSLSDGDKSTSLCEERAFRVANATLSTRSNQLKEADYVSWQDEDGVNRRGIIRKFLADDSEEAKDEPGSPTCEVERFKPVRDGYEPSGQILSLSYDSVNKIDALNPPSRVTRKDADLNDQIKSYIDDLLAKATSTKNSVTSPLAVKRLGENMIGGYGVVWGNEKEHDIEGDYFGPDTDLWLDTYKHQPLFFDHASGIKIPDDPNLSEEDQDLPRRYRVGHVVKAVPDDIGLWVEGVIDAHNDWVDGVQKLVDKGVLFFSSGSAPHLIKRLDNGAVKSWPIIELSLTPTPAEPRHTQVTALGGSVRTAEGELNNAARGMGKSTDKHVTKDIGSKTIMTRKEILRRLRGLLVAHYDDSLNEAVGAYKASKIAFAKATPEETPEAAAAGTEASSELEKMIGPIVDQAKSLFGLDGDMVKTALIKMALESYNKQEPTPEEELAEGEMPMAEGEMPAEMPAALPAAAAEGVVEDDLSGDAVPEDDYLEEGNPEELLDEEATMSFHPYRSTDLFSEGDEDGDYVETLVKKEVKSFMSKLPTASGGYAVKNVNVNTGKGRRGTPLRDMIKSVLHHSPTLDRQQEAIKRNIKALGINPATAGGYLVPIEQSNEVIELLRARSLFMRSPGSDAPLESLVKTMPLNSDTLTIPKLTGGSTASWVAENGTIPPTQPTFGQITLQAKKLAVLVPISNELLEDSDPDVEGVVRDDIAQSMARAVDTAILYGTGNNGQPRGIASNPDIGYTNALNAAPSYDNLNNLVMQVRLADIAEDDSWAWVLNPRDVDAFRSLQDGQGAYIFAAAGFNAAEVATPSRLLNYPYFHSNTVALSDSTGNGAGSSPNDETDIFFGHWRDVIVAYRKTLEIKASDVAGTAFQTDQLWIRAILRMDVGIRHDAAIAMYTEARKVVTV